MGVFPPWRGPYHSSVGLGAFAPSASLRGRGSPADTGMCQHKWLINMCVLVLGVRGAPVRCKCYQSRSSPPPPRRVVVDGVWWHWVRWAPLRLGLCNFQCCHCHSFIRRLHSAELSLGGILSSAPTWRASHVGLGCFCAWGGSGHSGSPVWGYQWMVAQGRTRFVPRPLPGGGGAGAFMCGA